MQGSRTLNRTRERDGRPRRWRPRRLPAAAGLEEPGDRSASTAGPVLVHPMETQPCVTQDRAGLDRRGGSGAGREQVQVERQQHQQRCASCGGLARLGSWRAGQDRCSKHHPTDASTTFLLHQNKGTPYAAAAAAAAASRRGGGTSTGLSLSDRIRSSSNGNKPALLRDRETKGAIESLKTLIQNRWNAQAGLLNLEVSHSPLCTGHASMAAARAAFQGPACITHVPILQRSLPFLSSSSPSTYAEHGVRPSLHVEQTQSARSEGGTQERRTCPLEARQRDVSQCRLFLLARDPCSPSISPENLTRLPSSAYPDAFRPHKQLQSLSLANNNLTSLVDLQPAALIRFVPKLQNLSLQNNRLAQASHVTAALSFPQLVVRCRLADSGNRPQFADLNPLSTVIGSIVGSKPGLGELKELMLTGNPLQEREMKRNAVDYQR